MNQFERRGLVDSVGVGPVDANLEGFLNVWEGSEGKNYGVRRN